MKSISMKLLTLLFVFAGLNALAQIPQTLSFQGVLLDPVTGQAKADGSYSFVFKIYNAATAGTQRWSETQSLTTADGRYNALLGSVTPIAIDGTESYWLEVVVEGNTLGRTKLASGAYLLDDDLEDLADGELSGSKVGSGINGANITSGTIDNARLDADLQDLADGSLSGSKVGSGINASNLTSGTVGNTLLDADLQDLADGSLSGSKVGSGVNAGNVTTGSMSVSRVAFDAYWYVSESVDFNGIIYGKQSIYAGIGGGSSGSGNFYGYIVNPSDRRLKENITELEYGLATILDLRPVSFSMIGQNTGRKLGLIAQEVQPLVKEIVSTFEGEDHESFFGLDYVGLVPVLIKAMQEQQAQIDALRSMVISLQNATGITPTSTGKE